MPENNNETSPALNPDEPLRWNMTLPGGKPLKWNTPGATWGGKVGDLSKTRTPMGQQNLAELRITQEWMTTLLGHLTAARDMMLEKAVPLDAEQRSTVGNIGLNNLGMVEAGLGLIKDNPNWFPAEFDRAEPAADMADRALWLQAQTPALAIAELWQDTLQALSSDILKSVTDAKPYINQGAKLSGTSDTRVATYNDYFKRYRNKKTPPPPAPTP